MRIGNKIATVFGKQQRDSLRTFSTSSFMIPPCPSPNIRVEKNAYGVGVYANRAFQCGDTLFEELPLFRHPAFTSALPSHTKTCHYCGRHHVVESTHRCAHEHKGCTATYCSDECRHSDWNEKHIFLCPLPNNGDALSSSSSSSTSPYLSTHSSATLSLLAFSLRPPSVTLPSLTKAPTPVHSFSASSLSLPSISSLASSSPSPSPSPSQLLATTASTVPPSSIIHPGNAHSGWMRHWTQSTSTNCSGVNPRVAVAVQSEVLDYLNRKRKHGLWNPILDKEESEHVHQQLITLLDDLALIQTLLNWFQIYAFAGRDAKTQALCSYILYGYAGLINHSCQPNVTWSSTTRSIRLVANEHIPANAELSIGYIHLELSKSERRDRLFKMYGFHCSCLRCQSPLSF